jgi:hypothetical protein
VTNSAVLLGGRTGTNSDEASSAREILKRFDSVYSTWPLPLFWRSRDGTHRHSPVNLRCPPSHPTALLMVVVDQSSPLRQRRSHLFTALTLTFRAVSYLWFGVPVFCVIDSDCIGPVGS